MIGVAELEAAKALLAQAKGALQPHQYELLQRGTVEAEAAFQRYSALARKAGQAAEVARGAQALSGAQRVARVAEGVGKVSRLAPALAALAILWPSETATQEQDYPSWMKARHQLEMKLRQVAADSQRVAEEIEAARRSAGAIEKRERLVPGSAPSVTSKPTTRQEKEPRKRKTCFCICGDPNGPMTGRKSVGHVREDECRSSCVWDHRFPEGMYTCR